MVDVEVRWRRAARRNSEVVDACKAVRAERGRLEADNVVKKVEEKEAKLWVDAVRLMDRQMQGGS